MGRFQPGERDRLLDSLFFATSATTGAGLNPVNVSDLSTGQQAVLLILMILGSPPTFDRLEGPSLGSNRARIARNPGLEGRSTPRPRNRLRSTTCLRSNPEISKLVAMLRFHCLSWISRPRAPVLEVFPSWNRLNGPLALSLLYLVRLELGSSTSTSFCKRTGRTLATPRWRLCLSGSVSLAGSSRLSVSLNVTLESHLPFANLVSQPSSRPDLP
jgi:hypothetical protein